MPKQLQMPDQTAEVKRFNPDLVPEKLKDWIDDDSKHQFDIKAGNSSSPFLHSSSFTEDNLLHGLVYARNAMAIAYQPMKKAYRIAEAQYPDSISLKRLKERYVTPTGGLPTKILYTASWYDESVEVEILSIKLANAVKFQTGEPTLFPEFRRTIAALCRIRVLMKQDDAELRRGIGREQDEGGGPGPSKKGGQE